MSALTLVAPIGGGVEVPNVLAVDDGRFLVGARVHHRPEDRYIELRSRLSRPDDPEGFGCFHVLVDSVGGLYGRAVAAGWEETAELLLSRFREDTGEEFIDKPEELRLDHLPEKPTGVLRTRDGTVMLRAKVYPLVQDDESIVLMRLLVEGFGTVQAAVSDYGRLVIVTGDTDKDAFQHMRSEFARKDIDLS
jgi:hypothetical protein